MGSGSNKVEKRYIFLLYVSVLRPGGDNDYYRDRRDVDAIVGLYITKQKSRVYFGRCPNVRISVCLVHYISRKCECDIHIYNERGITGIVFVHHGRYGMAYNDNEPRQVVPADPSESGEGWDPDQSSERSACYVYVVLGNNEKEPVLIYDEWSFPQKRI